VTSEVLFIKQIGLGAALGVVIDRIGLREAEAPSAG